MDELLPPPPRVTLFPEGGCARHRAVPANAEWISAAFLLAAGEDCEVGAVVPRWREVLGSRESCALSFCEFARVKCEMI